MKKFAPAIITCLLAVSPITSNASSGDIMASGLGGISIDAPLMLAGSINPNWGAGTGFHRVQPSTGSGYWRSNPDGQCWNNKYGC